MENDILVKAVENVYEEKLSKVVGFETKYKKLVCSFCGKEVDEVERLIAGNHVYICNECVKVCNEILHEEIK